MIDKHVHLYDMLNVYDFFSRMNQSFNSICHSKKIQQSLKELALKEGLYDSGFKKILSLLNMKTDKWMPGHESNE